MEPFPSFRITGTEKSAEPLSAATSMSGHVTQQRGEEFHARIDFQCVGLCALTLVLLTTASKMGWSTKNFQPGQGKILFQKHFIHY